MSASVIELISFIKEKHIVTSVSSPNGYPVRWIYQLEDPAAAGTLGAGALVVTTGLMMKDDPDTLGKMLSSFRRRVSVPPPSFRGDLRASFRVCPGRPSS